jgi:hypothetical protein
MNNNNMTTTTTTPSTTSSTTMHHVPLMNNVRSYCITKQRTTKQAMILMVDCCKDLVIWA